MLLLNYLEFFNHHKRKVISDFILLITILLYTLLDNFFSLKFLTMLKM